MGRGEKKAFPRAGINSMVFVRTMSTVGNGRCARHKGWRYPTRLIMALQGTKQPTDAGHSAGEQGPRAPPTREACARTVMPCWLLDVGSRGCRGLIEGLGQQIFTNWFWSGSVIPLGASYLSAPFCRLEWRERKPEVGQSPLEENGPSQWAEMWGSYHDFCQDTSICKLLMHDLPFKIPSGGSVFMLK